MRNSTPAFRRLLPLVALGTLLLTSCWSKEGDPRPNGQCGKSKTPTASTGSTGGNN
ncbi:hypothetical protein ACFQ48_17070 [Hymenobacter caeli]|uniref:Lipoprotein n=1 Tax=Hymenobacter caeli TaxID=2735894 RepID=A0ABX2FSH6_9BACT|nr:hypothetical protein [Hymenobacter caeli]NRT19419.1 hypothetical protein [Hymenobacter caeli]